VQAIRFKLDRRFIAAGLPSDMGHCALVLALYAAIPQAQSIRVNRETISLSNIEERLRYVYATPKALVQFQDDYDAGKTIRRLPMVMLTDDDLIAVKPMKVTTVADRIYRQTHPHTPSPGTGKKINDRRARAQNAKRD